MTTAAITESGMTFGPYLEGHCFHIEKSHTYERVKQDVRMAEFVLLHPRKDRPAAVWIVEAKSSTPRSRSAPGFEGLIAAIRKKPTPAEETHVRDLAPRWKSTSVQEVRGQVLFDDFLEEIQAKFTNALGLLLAMRLGRHPTSGSELPAPFQSLDLAAVDFRFILVVKGHCDEWLAPLKDALRRVVLAAARVWAISVPAVEVLNEALAREWGLILPDARGTDGAE